jgi:hypothetical protein
VSNGDLLILVVGSKPLEKLGGKPTLASLDDAALGVGESRQIDVRDLIECTLDLIETCLEHSARSRWRPSLCAWRLAGPGVGKERLAHRPLGDGTVGGEESLRFAARERVPADGIRERLLVGFPEGAQGECDGGRQSAGIETHDELGRE